MLQERGNPCRGGVIEGIEIDEVEGPAGLGGSRVVAGVAAFYAGEHPLSGGRVGVGAVQQARAGDVDSDQHQGDVEVRQLADQGGDTEWEILLSAEVESFLDHLYESDPASHQLVNQAILILERSGPAEGRPLVDSITASRIANMKELRPPSSGRSEVRILLVFDPWRAAILLVAGDKSGQWAKWYRTAIPRAEQLYDDYLAERRKEMGP